MIYAVCGGGGMLGSAMVGHLLSQGHQVRASDVKPMGEWWQVHPEAENLVRDLQYETDCHEAITGTERVIAYAEKMGGIGYIEHNRAECITSSALIHANLLKAARLEDIDRYFFSSSACVYRQDKQNDPNVTALKESDAFPWDPEPGYGEAKANAEQMCRYAREDWDVPTRIGRYHNIGGPPLSWNDGKEKSPAAMCRKVAEAKLSGRHVIDIWGDGEQTRSYCWLGDCIDGTLRLMESDFTGPVNIGTSEVVTINQLVSVVEEIAGIECDRYYDETKPQGVRGRSSDNTLCREVLGGWEPSTPLREWMPKLYEWIEAQVIKAAA